MAYSFQKFIEEKYFDYIDKVVKSFAIDNLNYLNIKSSLNYIDYLEIDDLYIKGFYIHDLSNDDIGISIIVETENTVKEYSHGDCECDSCFLWFMVKCKSKLSDTLFDFRVVHVEQYESLDKDDNGLTDSLIPYIKKERMDELADNILFKYNEKCVLEGILNPYGFAKKLGLSVIETEFKNKNTLGKIYFDDFVSKSGKVTKANTIKINKLDKEYSKNLSIMHECVHFLLHKKAFLLEKIYNKNKMMLECFNDGKAATKANLGTISWMEWQANAMASRLLMPKRNVINFVNERLSLYKMTNETNDMLPLYLNLIEEVSEFYRVPYICAKIRLVELGFDFALGCDTYSDGMLIPPYIFTSGYLKSNETFTIDFEDAAIFFATNNKEEMIGYVFVEGHIVINSEKYIMHSKENHMMLTDYARHHMDECAIKFELDLKTVSGKNEVDFKTYKILNRRKNNDSEIVVKIYGAYELGRINNNSEELKMAMEKVRDLIRSLNSDVGYSLKKIKEFSGFTIQEIIDGTMLSKNTIESYFSGKASYTKGNLIRLLLFMNCPYDAARKVLEAAGFTLTYSNDENYISFVFQLKWKESYDDKIKFLSDNNIYL